MEQLLKTAPEAVGLWLIQLMYALEEGPTRVACILASMGLTQPEKEVKVENPDDPFDWVAAHRLEFNLAVHEALRSKRGMISRVRAVVREQYEHPAALGEIRYICPRQQAYELLKHFLHAKPEEVRWLMMK